VKKLEACLRRQTSEEDRQKIIEAADKPIVAVKRKRAAKKSKAKEEEIISQDVKVAEVPEEPENDRRPNFEIIEKIERLRNMEIEDKDEPILRSSVILSYPVTPKEKVEKRAKRKSFLLENNINVLLSPSHTFSRREAPSTPKADPTELSEPADFQVPQITVTQNVPPQQPPFRDLLRNVNDITPLKNLLVSLVSKFPECESFARSELSLLPVQVC
jgi:hypothetical protein